MSLKKNISWTFLGNLVYGASQWGILIVLAKLTDVEVVGQFSLGLAITGPLFSFTNLHIRSVQITDVKDEYSFNNYFGFRLLSTSLALIIIIISIFFLDYKFETIITILIVSFAKAIESLSDVIYGVFQRYEKMKLIALSFIIKGPVSLLMVGFGTYYFRSAPFVAIALTVSWISVFLFFDIVKVRPFLVEKNPARRIFKPAITQAQIKRLTLISFPLGITILLNTLNFNIPKYFIVTYHGEASLGYYSAIAYLLMAGSTIVNAMGQSATPRLANYYLTNREAYLKLLLKLFAIAFLVGLIGVVVAGVAGKSLLTIIYTHHYAKYYFVFLWLMIGAALLYCCGILGCGITAARSFLSQSLFAGIVTITLIAACSLLVPKYGLIGAAVAVSFAYFLKLLAQIFQIYILIKKDN